MSEHDLHPGPYTLGNLAQAMMTHAPVVLRGVPQLLAGFREPNALRPATRMAVQLRLARLLGCPVCRALFPGLGRRAGLSGDAVRAALEGELAALPSEAAAAVAWIDGVVRLGGYAPEVTEATGTLSDVQRDHLVIMARLDIVIHSVGLMFLPHSMIEHACAG
jgi:alkylhydroperoxidase family enzyme